MSLDKIKEYLRTWIELDRVPNQFMEKNTTNMSSRDAVYILGSSLYQELTNEVYSGELNHINVRQPRVYQFLQRVLINTELDPKILLEILEEDKSRDTIEIYKSSDNYRIECFSSVGLTRLRNQDYLGCHQFKNATLLVVADGVGGANGGEIASKLTTDFVVESLKKYDLSQIDVSKTLREIVFSANQEVLNYSKEHNMGQMGTTLSIALIVEQKVLYIAHVGDSRIYEFNEFKKPRQITQDHSEVEILYRTEVITKEDKENYKKNVLRYAIGLDNLKKENIFIQHSYLSGDINLLLCSDGFWEKIDINDNLFCKKFDNLKDEIFNSIPTDNVTFIRYSSVATIENCEFLELPSEEDFEKEENNNTTPTKFKKRVKEKNSNPPKKSLQIEKINRILISIIVILSILFLIYFVFNTLSNNPINENNISIEKNISSKNTILPQDEVSTDSNITDTKELKKKRLQEEIEKTQTKLDEMKERYQRLIL